MCSKKGYCKYSFAAQNYYKNLKNTLANPKNKPIYTKIQGFFTNLQDFIPFCIVCQSAPLSPKNRYPNSKYVNFWKNRASITIIHRKNYHIRVIYYIEAHIERKFLIGKGNYCEFSMQEMLQHVFICVMQRKYKLTCYGIERIDYQ